MRVDGQLGVLRSSSRWVWWLDPDVDLSFERCGARNDVSELLLGFP